MFWVGVVDRRAAMERISCGMAVVINSSTMTRYPALQHYLGHGASSTRHAIRQNGAGSVLHAPPPVGVGPITGPTGNLRIGREVPLICSR
jgi:hypothetical protein